MTNPKDWKNRKKRTPKIIDKKLRGEWAEMVFMTRATELGIPISKPWGEMRSYDFIVGRPRHFVCVQVKSTIAELGTGYVCTVRGGHKPYPPRFLRLSCRLRSSRERLVDHSRGHDLRQRLHNALPQVAEIQIRELS
jgi:hypothetical protein